MTVYSRDIIPVSAARSRFSELVDEAKAGEDKIITKNGEAYVAIIDVAKLDYYRQLERERGRWLLLEDLRRGLEDIKEGRVMDAKTAFARVRKEVEANRRRRAAK
jgi:prevent-host-death family protein